MHSKYSIIGAGLSGLITANELLANGEDDFIILEGRDRTGGRILTQNHIDFGATWFQSHHENVNQLLYTLKIQKFEQYSKGQSVLVYSTMAPAHYFETQQQSSAAKRIVGGSSALIHKLTEPIKDKIFLNTKVTSIREAGNRVHLEADTGDFTTDFVVVTVPPKLAATITYSPELPQNLSALMKRTHTWMSNAIKVGLGFKTPFWREKNLSGTVIGQIGPVIELYDHCDNENAVFTLMGFVNEGLRDVDPKTRKERILSYLETHLGNEVREYTFYKEKDWSADQFTIADDLRSVYLSPQYGDKLYGNFQMNGKLFFSGTETSPIHGGYLDGAIYSGLRAARLLLKSKVENHT
ncbi:FAD-dependent oxidoreductase [Croceitalea sp. MTPC5]|uniref:flavin monoamine oxidase family protein n=1 Tax=Croceitalea sp. MTPC5 TaxID=3056565 RepID=UPI002B39F2A6|nr:FAD-dependent oxidoreductase [Croceitalea sp. MTPC5]